MNEDISRQEEYWDKEINAFDSIYTHKKNRFASLLDSIFRYDMYARYKYSMEMAHPIQDRTFIDVGCGTGKYSLELARRGADRVLGLDISKNMIEVCKQRALEEQLDNKCSFVQADLLEYQPDSMFDVCLAIGLFDYIKDPLPVLIKIRESIQGKAIISFPRFWTWRAPVRKMRLGIKKCNVYFYTKKRVDILMNKSGFNRYTIQKVGKLFCVTAFPEQPVAAAEWSCRSRDQKSDA